MKDKGTGAENLIWLASRQSSRAHPSSLAADDILAALTGRIAELEARVSAILAEVEPEPARVDSTRGRTLSAPMADASRGTDKMSRDARVEADAELTRASEERRMLANEMRLLREAFQEARSQPSAGPRASTLDARVAPDLGAAIADEMRVLLAELFADFRARAAPPTRIEPPALTSAIAAPPLAPEPTVEHVATVPAAVDAVTIAEPSSETVESIIEHVDELVRPPSIEPIVDEYVEELCASAPMAPTDALEVWAAPAETTTPIVDDYVEDLRAIETVAPTDAVELEAAPPEPATPLVDERVFEPLEPIVDEYVEELRRPEPTAPLGAIEPNAATPQAMEPIVEEYVEEFRSPEVIEPLVEYLAPAEPVIDLAIAPSALPPPADARIDALWDAASSPTNEAATAPLPSLEPPSSTTDEFIADTRSLEIPEAPRDTPQELALDPTMDFVPAPPMEFVPTEPEVVERELDVEAEPFVPAAGPEPTSTAAFPELRVADERGLHQIQIVISPIHSFPRLLETERRMRALSTVNALRLRDFRNGVATFVVAVSEAISPAEFGAVIQMLESLHLRLEGTTQSSVELHAEDESATE